jgi:hypothetical protein
MQGAPGRWRRAVDRRSLEIRVESKSFSRGAGAKHQLGSPLNPRLATV